MSSSDFMLSEVKTFHKLGARFIKKKQIRRVFNDYSQFIEPREKTGLWGFRPGLNRAEQPQKMARVLKFRI